MNTGENVGARFGGPATRRERSRDGGKWNCASGEGGLFRFLKPEDVPPEQFELLLLHLRLPLPC
ncbi:MAG: hypothetical protein H6Q82_2135 [Deltaproteobacteria bacterium]|nr:hypothetical protein [Deltaproteobacteria bacterium]